MKSRIIYFFLVFLVMAQVFACGERNPDNKIYGVAERAGIYYQIMRTCEVGRCDYYKVVLYKDKYLVARGQIKAYTNKPETEIDRVVHIKIRELIGEKERVVKRLVVKYQIGREIINALLEKEVIANVK